MNQYFEKIKKIFSRFYQKKVSYGQHGVRPKRDWHIIISTTAIFFCIICFLSWYIYGQVIGGVWFKYTSDNSITNHTINQTLLKSTIDAIDARNITLQKGLPIPSDPSL